jgi:glutaminase
VELPEPVPDRFVSGGHLPRGGTVPDLVETAHRLFASVGEGDLSGVYPALAEADPTLFGISVVSTRGETFAVGDARVPFTIMSVAKPFVFALACAERGIEPVRQQVGVNATGLAFNSASALERDPTARTNPMVNSGAIATASLIPGAGLEEKWAVIEDGLSRFAGRQLGLDESTLESALASNHRNRALANMLAAAGALAVEPAEVVELYTRQSCLSVTAVDLATMGATLADGGVNPLTKERIVDAEVAHATLAVMTIAGMYETSGDWLFDVGMPGKSGISGGILTVSPSKGGLGTFSPPIDAAGNSVRGQLATRHLARSLGLDLLASRPED